MTAKKAKRLSKVAKEINVGTATIIEFLGKKGYDVPSNPNTKIEPDAYEILLEKFQPDMLVKQKKEEAAAQAEKDRAALFGKEEARKQAEKAEKEKIRAAAKAEEKKETPPEPKDEKPAEIKETPKAEEKKAEDVKEAPAKETTAEKETEKTEVKEEKAAEEKLTEEAKKVEEPKPTKEDSKEKEETVADSENEKTEAPQKTTAKEEKTEPKESKEDVKEDAEEERKEGKGGLKVLGKIDVESTQKSKAKKPARKEEPKKDDTEEKETKAEDSAEKPKETTDEKDDTKTEQKGKESTEEVAAKSEEKPKEGDKESEVSWKEKREELKGLTVKGKIDLKDFEKKKKEDAKAADKKKRRRKRIKGSKAVSSTDDKDKLVKASRDPQHKRDRSPSQGRPAQGGQGQGNKRKRGRKDKVELDDKQIQNQIKETLSRLTNKDAKGNKTKLKKRKKEIQRQKAEEQAAEMESASKVIEVTEFITANDLANLMDVTVTDVITACMSLGMMVSINQRIDAETISLVADEFGFDVAFKDVETDEPSLEEEDNKERLTERPPIVTIMGHVDHGKTSLLDHIRKSNVIAGEAGGITQHIGAYEVEMEDGKAITFLDTPGHEAFTAMRARGAKVTDVVIIVVAADDKVMPQTKEAIAHAQAAGVPMVFAINKVDREAANPDYIKQQLADENILVEDWGGKYQCQEISAKTGMNIDDLLEKVLLESEVLELKADAGKRGVGTVIEASLDRGRGIVSTILIQGGTMRVGDNILAGAHFGKVKAMFNERGQRVEEAGPSQPVQILGFDGAPTSGDKFYVTKNEAEAKNIANERNQLIREQGIRATKHITLDEIGRRIAVGNFKELNVIVKGDVDGSVEALSDSLLKLTTEEIQVNVIHKAVGQISESDVLLASASDAVIVGFQVRPSPGARGLAEREQIEIRLYSIIYDAIEELKSAMEGMLEPKTEEKIVANVEVRETFKITKVGTIAGCMVTSGKISRNHKVRLIREGIVQHDGEIATLKRFKDDVKEVSKGYECGIQIEKYNDIKEGDVIEAYELVEVKRKLK